MRKRGWAYNGSTTKVEVDYGLLQKSDEGMPRPARPSYHCTSGIASTIAYAWAPHDVIWIETDRCQGPGPACLPLQRTQIPAARNSVRHKENGKNGNVPCPQDPKTSKTGGIFLWPLLAPRVVANRATHMHEGGIDWVTWLDRGGVAFARFANRPRNLQVVCPAEAGRW